MEMTEFQKKCISTLRGFYYEVHLDFGSRAYLVDDNMIVFDKNGVYLSYSLSFTTLDEYVEPEQPEDRVPWEVDDLIDRFFQQFSLFDVDAQSSRRDGHQVVVVKLPTQEVAVFKSEAHEKLPPIPQDAPWRYGS